MLEELLRQIERSSKTQNVQLFLDLFVHLFFTLVYFDDHILPLHHRKMFEFPFFDHVVDLPVARERIYRSFPILAVDLQFSIGVSQL